jgi:hypothetical protein
LTVIVVSFSESVFADHSKDHAVAVAYFDDTLTGSRTPLNRTSLQPQVVEQRAFRRWLRSERQRASRNH